jgi:hypothetical protein
VQYIIILFHVLKYAATVSKYGITNNIVRVVDKSAKGDLSSPLSPPSKAIFDLLPGYDWFGPVRSGYLSLGGVHFPIGLTAHD